MDHGPQIASSLARSLLLGNIADVTETNAINNECKSAVSFCSFQQRTKIFWHNYVIRDEPAAVVVVAMMQTV